MKSPLARYYSLRSDIAFFGFLLLSYSADRYWLRVMFFIFAIVIPAGLSYTAHQVEKRNEP